MAEYIEREALIDLIAERNRNTCNGALSCLQMKRMVKSIPAADVAPVRHGKWKPVKYNAHCSCGKSYGTYHFLCSACNHIAYSQPYGLTYCPNCGAKMDKEDTE